MVDDAGDLAQQIGREDGLKHAEAKGAAGLGVEQADVSLTPLGMSAPLGRGAA